VKLLEDVEEDGQLLLARREDHRAKAGNTHQR
jgi:hypothetical protein